MKRLIICILLAFISLFLCAQTLDDLGRIYIKAVPVNNRDIPDEAARVLNVKMQQFLNYAGIVDTGIDNRFGLVSDINVISKDIIAGSPSRVSQRIEVVFYVKDLIENKSFGSSSAIIVGVGINEGKSFINAFNSLKSQNEGVFQLIESAKENIIIYYRTNAEQIISKARALSSQGCYDEALYELALIPSICSEEFDKCQSLMTDIYRKKIEAEGAALLAQARAAWAESPDANGAIQATAFLAKINILASCQERVNSLLDEITEKVKDNQKKVWEFNLQQYKDKKAREQRDFEFKVRRYEEAEKKEEERHKEKVAREQRDFDFSVHQFNENMALQRAVLDASKEVAIAVAKNKQY